MRLLIAVQGLLMGVFGLLIVAVAPAGAQEVVEFPATNSVVGGNVSLRAELTKPEGPGPFPAVILMHGCGGWQPAIHYALQAHAEFLVKHGYAVLNLDSFGPRHLSGGALCASNSRLREALSYRAHDAFDAMQFLRTQPFIDAKNIFLVGQSNGGSVALEVATAEGEMSYGSGGAPFRAVAAYYPWCGVLSRSSVQLTSAILVLAGGKDDWVSARECEEIKAKGADFEVQVYGGAAHSFDVEILPQEYMGHLIGYDARATNDSKERMLAFFDRHLIGNPQPERVIAAAESGNGKAR